MQQSPEEALELAKQDRQVIVRILLRMEDRIVKLDRFARAASFGGQPNRVAVGIAVVAMLISITALSATAMVAWRNDATKQEDRSVGLGGGVRSERGGVPAAENP
jgi:hypothetical protein